MLEQVVRPFARLGVLTTRRIVAKPKGGATKAGKFVEDLTYVIATLGDTDFTLIGAASTALNVVFTATGPGVGTGTANANAVLTWGKVGTTVDGAKQDDGEDLEGVSFRLTSNNDKKEVSRENCEVIRVENPDDPDQYVMIDQVKRIRVSPTKKNGASFSAISGISVGATLPADLTNSNLVRGGGSAVIEKWEFKCPPGVVP